EFQTANAISIVTVIASASEAIHRWRSELESWIASSLSLLAMTSRHGFAISRREAPEGCEISSPRRAWGMPGAQCARSLACSVKNTRVRAYPAGLESGDSQRSADERVWRP